MKCKVCGEINKDDATVCSKCGASLIEKDIDNATKDDNQNIETNVEETTSEKTSPNFEIKEAVATEDVAETKEDEKVSEDVKVDEKELVKEEVKSEPAEKIQEDKKVTEEKPAAEVKKEFNGSKYCPKCGALLKEDSNYCPKCGAEIIRKKVCPKCGQKNEEDAMFCNKCGQDLKDVKCSVEAKYNIALRMKEQNSFKMPKATEHSSLNYVLCFSLIFCFILFLITPFTELITKIVNGNYAGGISFLDYVKNLFASFKDPYANDFIAKVIEGGCVLLFTMATVIVGFIGLIKSIVSLVRDRKPNTILHLGILIVLNLGLYAILMSGVGTTNTLTTNSVYIMGYGFYIPLIAGCLVFLFNYIYKIGFEAKKDGVHKVLNKLCLFVLFILGATALGIIPTAFYSYTNGSSGILYFFSRVLDLIYSYEQSSLTLSAYSNLMVAVVFYLTSIGLMMASLIVILVYLNDYKGTILFYLFHSLATISVGLFLIFAIVAVNKYGAVFAYGDSYSAGIISYNLSFMLYIVLFLMVPGVVFLIYDALTRLIKYIRKFKEYKEKVELHELAEVKDYEK